MSVTKSRLFERDLHGIEGVSYALYLFHGLNTNQLDSADKTIKVLETQIPIEFEESIPTQISESYHALVEDLGKFESNTVLDRIEKSYYKSIYSLYHDVRLSAYISLLNEEIGSPHYVDIDRFYKFATEFILRESYRLHIQISELEEADKKALRETPPSDFEETLSQDFVKISTTYSLGNSEAFFIITQNNVPLFSSLNQRSSLDEREILPPESFSTTTVVPQAGSIPATNLGFLSPQVGRIPQPTLPPTEILSRFLHPNWYSLPTAKWLEGSDLQSFAPVIDEQNTVVTSQDKGRLWLEQIGYTKFFEKTKMRIRMRNEEIGTISLDNLYEWAPGNDIDDDEIEAFEKGTESQFVNEILSKLQALKKKRLSESTELSYPTEEEKKLYHKANRILREIILSSGHVPDWKPSPSLPILQTNYSGTLPVPTQNINSKKKNKSRR
ncbi:unnamed protein product [Wickerhamomyces anomalus]